VNLVSLGHERRVIIDEQLQTIETRAQSSNYEALSCSKISRIGSEIFLLAELIYFLLKGQSIMVMLHNNAPVLLQRKRYHRHKMLYVL
jgi:hypothetical protein